MWGFLRGLRCCILYNRSINEKVKRPAKNIRNVMSKIISSLVLALTCSTLAPATSPSMCSPKYKRACCIIVNQNGCGHYVKFSSV